MACILITIIGRTHLFVFDEKERRGQRENNSYECPIRKLVGNIQKPIIEKHEVKELSELKDDNHKLRIMFLNIRYLSNNKVEELLEYINKNNIDLVALAEHGRFENDGIEEIIKEVGKGRWNWIGNYRKKYKRGTKRGSGGVAILARVNQNIKVENNDLEGLIWSSIRLKMVLI